MKTKHTNDKYEISEEILMSVPRAHLSKNTDIQKALKYRIEDVKAKNREVKPEVDDRYKCDTCGSYSGKCHPDTGYCYICDTDNWASIKKRIKI